MLMVDDFLWRTPLRHAVEEQGPVTWRDIGGSAMAETIGAGGRGSPMPPLAVVDLSPLPRLGFKGRETIAVMQARGVVLERQPNRAFRQPDGSLCLVLGAGDVFLLAALEGENALLSALATEGGLDEAARCYPVPRQDSHAWFAVCGAAAAALLAKLCAVDLRLDQFPDLAVAQTVVARISGIVLRADINGLPALHLLSESSAAEYMLACLLDAAAEFGGRLAGFDAISPGLADRESEGYAEAG